MSINIPINYQRVLNKLKKYIDEKCLSVDKKIESIDEKLVDKYVISENELSDNTLVFNISLKILYGEETLIVMTPVLSRYGNNFTCSYNDYLITGWYNVDNNRVAVSGIRVFDKYNLTLSSGTPIADPEIYSFVIF